MIASTAVIRKEDVVLFLDVDGVLTTRRCVEGDFEDDDESLYFYEDLLHPKQKEEGKNVEQGEEKKFLTPLEKSRVAMLKWVVDNVPNMKIVFSSTWRIDEVLCHFLRLAMDAEGIDTERVVVGSTPYNSSLTCRGNEITEWLSNNPVSNFAIVDDEHGASFTAWGLSNHYVRTYLWSEYREQGLSHEAASKIIDILTQPCSASISLPNSNSTTEDHSREHIKGPVLVLFCGIPGIGKDIVCECLREKYPEKLKRFRILSDDQFAKTHVHGPQREQACQQAVEEALEGGWSVILLRNNHTVRDRRSHIDISGRMGVPTIAFIPQELCGNKSVALLQLSCMNAIVRGDETSVDESVVPAVCSSYFRAFEEPMEDEMDYSIPIRYLNAPADSLVSSLDSDAFEEYNNFIPFSADQDGRPNALSFCKPLSQMDVARMRRSVEDVALDIIAELEKICDVT